MGIAKKEEYGDTIWVLAGIYPLGTIFKPLFIGIEFAQLF